MDQDKIYIWPSLGYATTKGIFAPTRTTSSNLRSTYSEGGTEAQKWHKNNYLPNTEVTTISTKLEQSTIIRASSDAWQKLTSYQKN
jgi:hypothetical protein